MKTAERELLTEDVAATGDHQSEWLQFKTIGVFTHATSPQTLATGQ